MENKTSSYSSSYEHTWCSVLQKESRTKCAEIFVNHDFAVIKMLFGQNGIGMGIYSHAWGTDVNGLYKAVYGQLTKQSRRPQDAAQASFALAAQDLIFMGLTSANGVLDSVAVPAQYFLTPQADGNGYSLHQRKAEEVETGKHMFTRIFTTDDLLNPETDEAKQAKRLSDFAVDLKQFDRTTQLKLMAP
jgi:hypothetical protein